MAEGIPQPSAEERERIAKAYEDADPTTFSERALTEEKTDLGKAAEGYENRLVGSRGEQYVKLERGEGDAAQFFVSKLLKGIVNVSDVVRDEQGVFYSKVMPLDKIQESAKENEVEADAFVMKSLTGDGEHYFTPESTYLAEYQKNLAHRDGKVAYFDFESRYMNPNENYAEQASHTPIKALEIADEKLDAVYRRLSGTMGTLFVKNILKESGYRVGDVFPAFGDLSSENDEDVLALQISLAEKVRVARSEILRRSAQLRAAA